MSPFQNWLGQPTTIHGLAVIAGTAGAALTSITTGNHTVDAAAGILGYVLVHLCVTDNTSKL